MGLSDIDEDDQPVSRPPPRTATATAQPPMTSFTVEGTSTKTNRTVNLDDLFNDQTPQSNGTSSSAQPAATSRKERYVSNSQLDDLFMSALPNSSSQSNDHMTGEPRKNTIYVDYSDAATHEDINLLDISTQGERCKFNNAESLLDGFEVHGRKTKTKPSSATHNTLKHLTRNKDENKITARLLSLMNYYDVLGVSHDATVEVIRRHYKQKALELHPDRVGREQSSEEMELFKVITEAHEVLTDPERRSKYDNKLECEGFIRPRPADPWY
ncbi:unnamed protein product [Phytomonas sp. EM1]|nr:unnamed protein product [Phytomonas sp. EM1]|eukprot:CCW59949.1 unnamed protein product [Phytomonas sp. isolate EM1]